MTETKKRIMINVSLDTHKLLTEVIMLNGKKISYNELLRALCIEFKSKTSLI